MRVTISPDGEVVFDTDDVGQAAAMIAALRNGAAPKKKREAKPESIQEPMALSPQLAETWEWLVAHDNPRGRRTSDVATGLGIAGHNAGYRLKRLVDLGLARSVKRGYYRPGEK